MNIAYTVFHSDNYADSSLLNRKNNVESIHAEFGKSFEYIDNDVYIVKNFIDYKNIIKKNLDLRKIKIKGSFRFGAVGLIMTTFLAYRKMLNSNNDIFLIFEDDAQLSPNAIDLVKQILDELPDDFDILSMYDNKAFHYKYNKKHDCGLQNICLSYNDRSTLVYAISKNGIKKYLKYMENIVDAPIDVYLFDENKDTAKYAIKPKSSKPFYSDFFVENGDPDYENSSINKTEEFFFKYA